MTTRSRRLLVILVVVMLGILALAVAIVALRGFQIDTARSDLYSRGIRCQIESRRRWGGSLRKGRYVALFLAANTDVRSTPQEWTAGPLSDADWLEALPMLQRMPAIRSVTIEYAAIGSGTLQTLDRLPELESLSLTGCDIDDSDLAALADVSGLRSLNLSSTRVSGVGLSALQDLPRLAHLYLDGTPISHEGVDAIATLNGLTSLSLSNTGLAESEILKLEEALPGVLISDD